MVTVKEEGVPVHPLRVGVTVTVPLMFAFVLFVGADQEVMLPVPLATRPIRVLEFDQMKVPPAGTLTKAGTLIVLPGQTAIFETGDTVGVGYTVTEKFIADPAQPLRVGITAILPTKDEPVLFGGAGHALIFPDPLAPMPIAVLVFVHV